MFYAPRQKRAGGAVSATNLSTGCEIGLRYGSPAPNTRARGSCDNSSSVTVIYVPWNLIWTRGKFTRRPGVDAAAAIVINRGEELLREIETRDLGSRSWLVRTFGSCILVSTL